MRDWDAVTCNLPVILACTLVILSATVVSPVSPRPASESLALHANSIVSEVSPGAATVREPDGYLPGLPSSAASPPSSLTVAYTLDSCTGTLLSGNALPTDCSAIDPEGAAVDTARQEIFVSNYGSNSVSVVNASSDTVLGSIPVASGPDGVAYDGNDSEVFVADHGSCVDNPCAPGFASVIDDLTDTVVASVTVGVFPEGIGYDSGQNEMFVANYGSNNVSVISVKMDKSVSSVAVGTFPLAVAYDTGKGEVFVVNYGSDNVSVIDAKTNSIVATIPVGKLPDGAAYDGQKGEVFVADSGSSELTIINDTTDKVTGNVSVGPDPWAVAYDSHRQVAVVANYGSDNLSVINGGSDKLVATVPVGISPDAVAYYGTSGEIVSVNYGSDNLTLVNDTTFTVSLSIADGTAPVGLAYDSAQGEIFMAAQSCLNGPCIQGALSVIDQSTDHVVATIAVGDWPSGLTYDTRTKEIFATNYGSDNVSVINGSTDRVIASITVGRGPEGIQYDPLSSEIMVANSGSDNVSIINDSLNRVVANRVAGARPSQIAFDRADGNFFVADSGSNNVTVINGTSLKVAASIPVGASPQALAYDAQDGYVFVANDESNNMSVIDPAVDSVATNLPLGRGPDGVAYDDNNGDIFVSEYGSDYVSVISSSTPALVANVTVGAGPQSLAYDQSSGFLYASNIDQGTLSILSTTTLVNVIVTPSSAAVIPDGTTAPFTATAICTSTCPTGTSYSWTLNDSSLGSLSSPGTMTTTFSAASTSGLISLFVNATLDGTQIESAPVAITVTYLESVAISPSSATVAAGGYQNFTAVPTCSGACPLNISFAWNTTNSSAGVLNATGGLATFSAGSVPGSVGLFVNASFYGTTRESDEAEVTIVAMTGVRVSPAEATVGVGGTTPLFSALTTCSSTCPKGINYTWSLSNPSLGTLGSPFSQSTNFTASDNASTEVLTVTASLGGHMLTSSATVTIIPVLSMAFVTPPSSEMGVGKSGDFLAALVCLAGPCPSGATYSWSASGDTNGLNSSSGAEVKFLASNRTGSATIYLNATLNGVTKENTANISIVPSLVGASVFPSSLVIGIKASAELNASATCDGGSCPGGTDGVWYSWAVSNSLGAVNHTTSPDVTFTAGLEAGSLSLTVVANFDGATTPTVTVAVTILAVLSSVAVRPSSYSMLAGSTADFTANSTCSGGSCPSGLSYSWTMSRDLGKLNSTEGPSVEFTAGRTAGTVYLTVNVSLNGKSASSQPVAITVTAATSTPPAGFLGLPGYLGYALVASVIALAVALFLLWTWRRSQKGTASGTPGAPQTTGSLASDPEKATGMQGKGPDHPGNS